MGKIRLAKSPREVLDVFGAYVQDFDEIHAATCLYEIAQKRHLLRRSDAESSLLRDLVDFTEWHMPRMIPYTLANTAWSVAQLRRDLGTTIRRLMPPIADQSILTIGKFNARDLSNLAWSFATAGECHLGLFQKIAGAFTKKLQDADAQNLSNLAWSFATLGIRNTELMAAVAARAALIISTFGPQHLSNLAWSLATLGIRDEVLMDAIAGRASSIMHTFMAQGVSNLAWSFAKLGLKNQTLMDDVAKHAAVIIDTLETQHLSNLAWSFATLRIGQAGFMAVLAGRTLAVIDACNAQGLSNLAWAFWRSGVADAAFARGIGSAMRQVSKDVRRDGNLVMNWAMTMSLAAEAGVSEEQLVMSCAKSLLQPGLLNKASDYSISVLARLAEQDEWSAKVPELSTALVRQVRRRSIIRTALESDLIADPPGWTARFG